MKADHEKLGAKEADVRAEELPELHERDRKRIAELETAHAGLRAAETKYRTLVERLPAIVYHADFGETGAWRYVSPQIESILGFSPNEWMADPELWYRQIHPEDRERAIEDETRSRATGEALVSEYRMLTRDGRVVWFRDEATVLPEADGTTRSLQGIMYDITEGKRAEEETYRSEARKSAILEAAMDCVITMDHEGKVVEFNPAAERTFGYRREDALGKPLGELIVPPSLRKAHREGLARYLATGEGPVLGKRLELTGMRADGAEFPVELAITRVDVPGSPLFTGYLRDITERKRGDQALRETVGQLRRTDEQRRRLLSRLVSAQEEERSQIAQDIHDDTIQVMSAVGIRLDLLRRATVDPKQLSQLEELNRTVTLTVTRLRNLMFELRPPALNREGLAAALRVYLDQERDQQGLDYTLESLLHDEPPTETRVILYRIAQEALMNVRKHAHASNVDVALENRDGGVLIRVTDDGVGFSLEEGDRYRPGHLGLVSIRERAELAGGWCRIESEPGAGTSVEVWVPAPDQDEEAAS